MSHVHKPQSEVRLMVPSHVPPGTHRALPSGVTHIHSQGPCDSWVRLALLPSPGDVVFEAKGDRPGNPGRSRMPKKGCRAAPLDLQAACSGAGRDPQTGQADWMCGVTAQCKQHPHAAPDSFGPGWKLTTSCVYFQVGAIRELLSRALPIQTASEVKPATG